MFLLCLLLCCTSLLFLVRQVKEYNRTVSPNMPSVRYHSTVLFGVHGCSIAFALCAFAFSYFNCLVAVLLVVAAIALTLLCWMLGGFSAQCTEDGVLIRRCYGKYKSIRYSEIHSLSYNPLSIYSSVIVRLKNGKECRFPSFLQNVNVFYSFVIARIQSLPYKKSPIPRVRKLKDSVNDLQTLYSIFAGFAILWVSFAFILVMLICYPPDGDEAYVFIIAAIVAFAGPFVTIFTLKRAHSSEVCDCLARHMVREVCLRPGFNSIEDLLRDVEKKRNIIFEHNGNQYRLSPVFSEDRGNQYSLYCEVKARVSGKPLFIGSIEELLKCEFCAGKSLKNDFDEINFTHSFQKIRLIK